MKDDGKLAFFDCEAMGARISAKHCLINQGRALALRGMNVAGARLHCLDCLQGELMVAYPPGAIFVPTPDPTFISQKPKTSPKTISEPVTQIRTPQKLPAWLKNATAAVRRDYLRGTKV
jgi:hypothetical protein